MPNRISRIFESIKVNAGNDVFENIVRTYGTYDEKATLSKQSTYLKSALNELEKISGANVLVKVMKPCGYQCISNNIIERAKALHIKSTNLENYLRLLNEQFIGGGKLHIRAGKVIGIYEMCYCGLAMSTKNLSPLFCNCSIGWYERLFSSVFEKPIEVKIVHTILDGSSRCEFEITL